MTLLTIGSGHSAFTDFLKDDSRRRIASYGDLFEASHIVAFTRRGFSRQALSNNVFVYPTNSFWRFFAPISALVIASRILRSIGKEDVVISAQDPFESGMVAWLISKIYDHPLHLQVHTDPFSPYFRKVQWENRVRVPLARFLLPRANCIRVVSQRVQDEIIKELGVSKEKIAVLPIFVDVSAIREEIASSPRRMVLYGGQNPVFLMVSRLTKEKNIPLALEVWRDVVKQFPHSLLFILGEGEERYRLEALVRKYRLQENVRFGGWNDYPIPYFAAADFFLVTSNYEGYGRTAVEALAAGCPVIMTDVGLAGEVVKDRINGLIVPVGNRKALADSIIGVLRNRDLWDQLKSGAGNFTYEADATKYLESYQKAILACVRS